MGWLAVGFCTFVAAIVLYNILLRERPRQKVNPHTVAKYEDPRHEPLERRPDTTPAPEEFPSAITAATTILIEPPVVSLEDSEPEGNGIPSSMAGEPSSMAPEMPRVSMPSPPPPPRRTSSSPPRLKPPTSGGVPAPPRPGNGFIRPPPSAAASLRVPPTKVLSNASLAPTSSIMPPGQQVSRKVVLEPGHSPLDWAALTSDPNSRLRGKDAPENLIRVTPTQLKHQNGRKGRDAWTVYQGKVYNITPYVPFHPGGKGEILRGAGKDSVKLFMETHPWVNWDAMLGECLVGILVGDQEAGTKDNDLDEMD